MKLTKDQKRILELTLMGAWINGWLWFAALYINNLVIQLLLTFAGIGCILIDAKMILLIYEEDKKCQS